MRISNASVVKLFVGLVVLVLVAEIVWGAKMLVFDKNPANASKLPQNVSFQPDQSSSSMNTLSLQTSKNTVKVGEKFTVKVNISATVQTVGADVIIKYDPTKLSVVMSQNKPVEEGKIYEVYPANKLDKTAGKISFSGVMKPGKSVKASGVLGLIEFQALAPGSSAVAIEYLPNSTNDSNITELSTLNDVLNGFNNLDIKIQ